MGLITKINGLAYANIAKYSGVTKVNTKKVSDTGNFHNKNAVSRSITAPGDQSHGIFLADSNGDFKFDHDDAVSISFWIKPGWDSNDNSTIVLFHMEDHDATAYLDDEFLIYYYEPHNRVWVRFGSSSGNYHQNFWHSQNLDPGGSRDFRDMLNASGLGDGNGWDSSNRGNVGNDNYTLITLTKGTSNNAHASNMKLYWNGTDCGYGYYGGGESGGLAGTVSMGTSTDKAISLGGRVQDGDNIGNNTETKYMGLTIWNKTLSASEVSELYNSGAPLHVGTHSAYANCVGWWPFQDDGTGQIAGTEAFAISGDSNIEAK
tara:strand:- start:33 stop:986 length:954 start_codon:yes stop_codon:yes gene_type:complete